MTHAEVTEVTQAPIRPDGRATRWAEHRLTRRTELVEATLRAIRRHGASVGMDEIAAEAGTSKTVLYRHFGDRTGLYLAVVDSVDQLITRNLDQALAAVSPPDRPPASLLDQPERVVTAAVDAYLTVVERDPEVYRYVVSHPMLERPMAPDPVSGLTTRIGDQLAQLIADALTAHGRQAAAAGALAHGVVGLVRAAADHWLGTAEPLPRTELTQLIATVIDGGLSAVLAGEESS